MERKLKKEEKKNLKAIEDVLKKYSVYYEKRVSNNENPNIAIVVEYVIPDGFLTSTIIEDLITKCHFVGIGSNHNKTDVIVLTIIYSR